MPFTEMPYAPPPGGMYNSRPGGDRIVDLMLRQGDIAARGAAASGQIWGNAVRDLGEIGGHAFEDYQAEKKAKKQAKALSAFVDSGAWRDPRAAFQGSVDILGPEKGPVFAQGLMATAKMVDAKGPDEAKQHLPPIARALLVAPDASKPALYSQARDLILRMGITTPDQIPEAFTPELMPMIQALAGQDQQKLTEVSPGASLFDSSKGTSVFTAPGAAKGPENPEPVTINGKPTMATPSEIAQAKASGAEVTPYHAPEKPPEQVIGPSDFSPTDLELFPKTWLDVDEGTKTREDYSTRPSKVNPQGGRVTASDAASLSGRVLPSKKEKEAVLAGQEAVAQATRMKALLDSPVDPAKPNGPKVSAYFGPGEGRMASLRSAGWIPGQPLPASVIAARAALAKFSAKDRHELFGSALTKVESQFAVQFEPDLNAPGETIKSQLDAYIVGITKGFESTWGPGRAKPTAPSAGGLPSESQAEIDRLFGK